MPDLLTKDIQVHGFGIGVEDADALLEEYRGKGAKIRHQPKTYLRGYNLT